jgi:WD40 repeat protein
LGIHFPLVLVAAVHQLAQRKLWDSQAAGSAIDIGGDMGDNRAAGHLGNLVTMTASLIAMFIAMATGRAHAQCDGPWQQGEPVPGLNSPNRTIEFLCPWDPDGPGPLDEVLVAGGHFDLLGGATAVNAAMWNGERRTAMGTEATGGVNFLLVRPDGSLLAAGTFEFAGNPTPQYLARWNGTAWEAFGPGPDGVVRGMANAPNGDLYIAGGFESVGGVAAHGVASWNGVTWTPMGVGVDSASEVAVLQNGQVVVGGWFQAVDGIPVRHSVAVWNGSSWVPLGEPAPSERLTVSQMIVAPNGDLIASGEGFPYQGVVRRWDGAEWETLGDAGNHVYSIAVLPTGDVLAGVWGHFLLNNNVVASRIARWDGVQWNPLGAGLGRVLNPDPSVEAIAVMQSGRVFVAGWFEASGSFQLGRYTSVAEWDGQSWRNLGRGLLGAIEDFAVMPQEDGSSRLVAVGGFANGNHEALQRVGVLTEDGWQPLGSGLSNAPTGSSFSRIAAVEPLSNGELVACGEIDTALVPGARYIARWDGAQWSPLGSGCNDYVLDLAVLHDGLIVAGGDFREAGGVQVNAIASWDGVQWSSLGNGMMYGENPGHVYALLTLPDGRVVAGGLFSTAGDIPAANIAVWNGLEWSPLGDGIAASVRALALLPNGDLIAGTGGWFDGNGGIQAHGVARWDGESWTQLGTGFSASGGSYAEVETLAPLPDGRIVVGGSFSAAGTSPASNIAIWDGLGWSALGSGTSGAVKALQLLPDGRLAIGGDFENAGGQASGYFALWDTVSAINIAVHPSSVVAALGSTIMLSASADSNDALQYQWRRNGVPLADGLFGTSNLSGATTPTLAIGNYSQAVAGQFDCVVNTACESRTTRSASVTCFGIVETQPQGVRSPVGRPATLQAGVIGGVNGTYRWRKDGSNLFNSSLYSGVTTPTLTVQAIDPVQSGAYSLAITTPCGTAYSDAAVIDIYCPADLDDGSATGTIDGGVDINDLLYFLEGFESGSTSADLDDGSLGGRPDGGIDINDLLYFLLHF